MEAFQDACVLYVLEAADGVGWVRSGLVEIAVGRENSRMLQYPRRHSPRLGIEVNVD
jgi:hypothetical protein